MAENIINGSDLYVFVDTIPLAHATSYTLSINMGVRNTSNKDTGLWETNAPGRFTATASCDGLVAYGSFETIVTQMIARAPLALFFGRKIGDVASAGYDASATFASGYFYVTSWEQSAPDAANATYTVNFEHCSGFAFVSGGNY